MSMPNLFDYALEVVGTIKDPELRENLRARLMAALPHCDQADSRRARVARPASTAASHRKAADLCRRAAASLEDKLAQLDEERERVAAQLSACRRAAHDHQAAAAAEQDSAADS